VIGVSGRIDALVPAANGVLIERLLPNCRHEVLDRGHFVWEDAADPYVRLATDRIRTDGAAV